MKPHGPVARRGFIERTLRHLAGDDLAESAWGDLEEEAAALAPSYGRVAARIWISLQGLRLIVGWINWHSLSPVRWGGEVTMDGWTDRRRRLVAIVGALAAVPAVVLVASGLLYSLSGSGDIARALDSTLYEPDGFLYRVLLHPITILGGLAVAVALNLIPLLRIRLEKGPGNMSGTIALRLRGTHLAIAAAGLGLLAMILAYAFTENFEVVARAQAPRAAPAAVASGAGGTAVRHTDEAWTVRGVAGDEILAPAIKPCRWNHVLTLGADPQPGPVDRLTFIYDCAWPPGPD